VPAHLERVLLALEAVSQQIAEADTELRTLATADARMTRLMTVPGVGPVTAARFVAAIDDVERFPAAASVASYLGLVPGENTTGFRTKRTRLTRRCAAGTLGLRSGGLVARYPTEDGSNGAMGKAGR
jgi:transposase